MRHLLVGLTMMAPLALVAMPAQAQANDPAASVAIAQGDYASAERTLLQELRIHPGRPELLLNLAAVYSRTGRVNEAQTLYRQVLGQRDVLMDIAADRTAGSHAVANTGLRRIETASQLTVR
ncbi:tetratricopeptide repeat protein [Sphingomonas sp. AOB5]|uniref:tetratricopeptide repeat protein n=1 Tax=Sphingomonas sp. AOB5 TaxID=3034017 RepID=UPI0023F6FE9F|nr:tetratricopeptide repeat protein [Sphingomonas sp. AOB5]MDF7776019.1 tetratricopeptide repeat protein [Sphingomonas sp. AOB5]